MSDGTFTVVEYILLGVTLLLSLIVGLYYAVFRKQNTATEYLHGGKNMNYFAVSLSIISSMQSGVTFISVPTEIYQFGIHYIFNATNAVFVGLVSYFLITPVFYKLEVTSIYEYLEMRFDRKVKMFASGLYTLQVLLYLPLVIYTPSLAIAQVTKINVHLISPVICLICIIYTVFGGIKAVIWTDTLQALIMFGSVLAVVIIGVIKAGGFGSILSIAYNTDSFDIDPTKRDTFWAAFIGTFGQLITVHVYSQGNIQKYLSLKSYKDVKKTHFISLGGLVLTFVLCTICGFIAITAYVYCDPKKTGKIERADQLLPSLIMDISTDYPGLAGVFVAGIISAGLSTLSAGLNSLAATMYKDFFVNILPKEMLLNHEATTLKVMALIIGIACVGLGFVVEQLGNLLPLVFSVIGITSGPMAGLFTMGLFMPKISSKAALISSIITLIMMSCLVITTQIYKVKKWITDTPLPTYTNSCIPEITSPWSSPPSTDGTAVFPLLKLSHYYYSIVGIQLTLLIGLITNYFITPDKKKVKNEYLSPIVHYFRNRKNMNRPADYEDIEEALKITNDNSEYDNVNSYDSEKNTKL